jgi:Ca2+-transporting ATPase
MLKSFPILRLQGIAAGKGLTSGEVERRRGVYGANAIIEDLRGGWRELARDTARDPMIWFLFATSLLFAIVQEWNEALVLMLAIGPLVGMDLYLHRRTQASTASLRSGIAETAAALRNDAVVTVAASELVPGDLVLLGAGESFPADGLIVVAADAQVDESALTGESFPVRKQAFESRPQGRDEISADVIHWGFAGTRLLTGDVSLRIVYTGAETLYGGIARSVARGQHERTPLQTEIAGIVRTLLVAAAVLCAILAWVRLQQGFGMVDALLSALTLAIAAIPEEFPLVFTFFLGVGVYRLAKRRALVRRAVVVENIGRISFICSDKTGTITEGRLRLAHIHAAAGYQDRDVLNIAALASRPDSGDPLDQAVLEAAPPVTAPAQRVASFPFTEQRRCETAILAGDSGDFVAALKGAPETVFAACRLADSERASWQARLERLASGAHKVIACASRSLSTDDWSGQEPGHGYRLAGLLAFEDPVRAGVPGALHTAQAAGIHVLMMTGDHPATATAVARELGMGGGRPAVIDGDELDRLLEANDVQSLRTTDVVARTVPAQKFALVRTLQAAGEIVAVTGDGVNDAPALQAADIGISMGERGTRSAREASSIVLLDDDFSTIINAISEGRQLFRNLQLSFSYLLMVHIPLVISAAIIPLSGHPLLYLPIHIVWLELIIHPTALLAFQQFPAAAPLAAAWSTSGKPAFFGLKRWLIIAVAGIAVTLAVTLGYERSLGAGRDIEHARAMAMLVLIIASSTTTAMLSRLANQAARVTAALPPLSAFVMMQLPWSSDFLHLAPLHLDDWLIAAAVGFAVALPAALLWPPARATPHP